MSTRLSKHVKATILSSVIEKTMWARLSKLYEEQDRLTEHARVASLKGREGEAKAAIKKIEAAEKSLRDILGEDAGIRTSNVRDNSIWLNCNGMKLYRLFVASREFQGFDFDKLVIRTTYTTQNRIVGKNYSGNPLVVSDPALAEAIMDNEQAIEAFNKEVEQVAGTIRGILNQSTTLKKLRALWPECDNYLPEGIEDPQSQTNLNLPVSIETLNATLTKYAEAA